MFNCSLPTDLLGAGRDSALPAHHSPSEANNYRYRIGIGIDILNINNVVSVLFCCFLLQGMKMKRLMDLNRFI